MIFFLGFIGTFLFVSIITLIGIIVASIYRQANALEDIAKQLKQLNKNLEDTNEE